MSHWSCGTSPMKTSQGISRWYVINYVGIIVRVGITQRKYVCFIHLIHSFIHLISCNVILCYFVSFHFSSVVHVFPSFFIHAFYPNHFMHFHHFINFIDFMHSLVRLIISFHWYQHVTSFLFLMFVFIPSFARSCFFSFTIFEFYLFLEFVHCFPSDLSHLLSFPFGLVRFVSFVPLNHAILFIHTSTHSNAQSSIQSLVYASFLSCTSFIHLLIPPMHSFHSSPVH
jgi:hypothetical protein